jgi:hypothetical protein
MKFTERYAILNNIIAQRGLDVDLYQELAKAESMINMIEQQKLTPPPVPPEITDPAMSQEPRTGEPMVGKYDDL